MTTIASPPKAHGIPFKAPMVRALLNTKPGVWPAEAIDPGLPIKFQTRRIVKIDPCWSLGAWPESWGQNISGDICVFDAADPIGTYPTRIRCPHPPGTLLWVKETWVDVWETSTGSCWTHEKPDWDCRHFVEYEATVEDGKYPPRWKSSMLMPRIASRIDLLSKSVRVERAQDISDADAIAEGFTGRDGFAALWLEINGEKSWDENPFVFVYTIPRTK